jgi:hypothetical protein
MNRNLKALAATALFGMVVAATPAFAAGNERIKAPNATAPTPDEQYNEPAGSMAAPTVSTFKDIDINADGFVTRDEVTTNAVLTQRFAALDKNSDGKLSQDECSTSNGKSGCYR